MKIYLTGASGFIGTEFAKQARAAGHELVCPGREWVTEHPVWSNESFDAVVHLAAAGVKREGRNWTECMAVNFHATRTLLQAACAFGPRMIIVAGSVREVQMDYDPSLWDDPYYVSKKLTGLFVETLRSTRRGVVVLKLPSCYAEGQVEDVARNILEAVG